MDAGFQARILEAITTPYRWRPGSRPTVEQALVEAVRLRDGADVPAAHILQRIAQMPTYERCLVTARVWRRYQPDMTVSELQRLERMS